MKRIFNLIILSFVIVLVSCAKEDPEILLSDLAIDPDHVEMVKGTDRLLKLVFTPDNIADKSVQWSSSNERIVSVDPEGRLIANEEGLAVVTAISNGIMANCKVTVTNVPVEKIMLDEEKLLLKEKQSFQLHAATEPEDFNPSLIRWTSSDENIVLVTQTGLVTAIAPGSAEIVASSGDISAVCAVEVESVPSVGDFFYSDGTYSSELDASKTVVGIVCWDGDVTIEDPVLRKEHPECTHGLVMSLTENQGMFMSKNYDYTKESGFKFLHEWVESNLGDEYEEICSASAAGDNGNKTMGYNNTSALIAFNEASENADWKIDIIERLKDFKKENPLPENTSGWYVPSVKEVYVLANGTYTYNIFWGAMSYANMEILNSSLSKVEGAVKLCTAAKQYWSCTEDVWYGFYFVDLKLISTVPGKNPPTAKNAERYVFAF